VRIDVWRAVHGGQTARLGGHWSTSREQNGPACMSPEGAVWVHRLSLYFSDDHARLYPLLQCATEPIECRICSKNGNYYILDRRNGMPIFPVKEVTVPASPVWQN
jgi:hypothetical protein